MTRSNCSTALLLWAACGPAFATAQLVVPAPQRLTQKPSPAQVVRGWPVGCATCALRVASSAGDGIAARKIADLTASPLVAFSDLPTQHFIAVGLLQNASTSRCPAPSILERDCGNARRARVGDCLACLAAKVPVGTCTGAEVQSFCDGSGPGSGAQAFAVVAEARGITAADVAPVGVEGYLLDISPGAIILAALSEAGLFNGLQSLRQLLIPPPHTSVQPAPSVRLVDWPSTPVRGAYLFGMPSFDPQTLDPAEDPGVQWMLALADRMASLKMNTGIVTSGFWEWLDSSGDTLILTKLRAIKQIFDERHIDFVPSLGCGSGGQENGNTETENTAEGVWVQGIPLLFDIATDLAHPVVGLHDLRLPPNGNFSGGVLPRKGAPAGWFTEVGSKGVMEWSLAADQSPWPGGSSMRCAVTQSPGGSSSYLYSNDMTVQPGQMLQLHFHAKIDSGSASGDALPKFELIFHGGGSLELDIGGHATDDVRLRPSVAGRPLTNDWSEWTEAQQTFRVPPAVTAMSIMVRLQGMSVATWWVTGVEIVNLDGAMRNIIRTSATDIELNDVNSGKKYKIGTDFIVENPETENTAHHLYVDQLDEYVVRRLPSGSIPRGARVLGSFDYLPGKVNSQGHSTPGAFGEPSYYDRLASAVERVAHEFGPLRLINFDHDEIRGMARDSRSLRLGLSNAELLARDLNMMQVHSVSLTLPPTLSVCLGVALSLSV